MIKKTVSAKKTVDSPKKSTAKAVPKEKVESKKAVVKAARASPKNIVKPEPTKEKKAAPAKKWQKVQTAEGWKRGMLKKRKAAKS